MNPNKFSVGDRVTIREGINKGQVGKVTLVAGAYMRVLLDDGREVGALHYTRLSSVFEIVPPCDDAIKVGDRVVVSREGGKNYGKEGDVISTVYITGATVRFDNGDQRMYSVLSLTRVFVPVDERAELVKVHAEAAQRRKYALEEYTKQDNALAAASDALKAYDEARRESTFTENLDALGLGAVIRYALKRANFVKLPNGGWLSDLSGKEYRSDEFSSIQKIEVVSEGLKA